MVQNDEPVYDVTITLGQQEYKYIIQARNKRLAIKRARQMLIEEKTSWKGTAYEMNHFALLARRYGVKYEAVLS